MRRPVRLVPPKAFMLAHLWIPATILAALSQTLRNVMQRDLIAVVGTVGATHARFLYGLPFGVLFLLLMTGATGEPIPVPPAVSVGWTALGGMAQIAATALMLQAMRSKSFLVTIAYTKTEPVQVALFGLVFLAEEPGPLLFVAIVVATVGVMMLSWPKAGAETGSVVPSLLGIASGGLFGISAVFFKLGIQSTGAAGFLLAASTTLATGLAIQTLVLTGYLMATDRPALVKLFGAWRLSLKAGFLGAFASQMWFIAFALEPVAHVRTLALVEILFSLAVSRTLLAQMTSPREGLGIGLLVAGVVVVLNA